MPGHWAQAIVDRGLQNGYVNGYPDGTFRPDQPVTRAELIKMALTASGVEAYTGRDDLTMLFPDLVPDYWLVRNGFSNPAMMRKVAALWGTQLGQPFGVNRLATRAEIATLAAYLALKDEPMPSDAEQALSRFSDLKGWNNAMRPWVGLAAQLKLINGFPDGTFRPDDTVTRAQAVVILEQLRITPPPGPTCPPLAQRQQSIPLAAGGDHSLAVKKNGTVWTWGANDFGQLGDGTTTNRTSPVQLPGLVKITAAAGGLAHSLALQADGTLWAWGRNDFGQIGDGSTTDRKEPAKVVGMANAISISAGYSYSLAVKQDGTVWAWGRNDKGQLGEGSSTDHSSPIQVSSLHDMVAVAAGDSHSLALGSDGSVWSWGSNDNGQLGNGTTTRSSTPVKVQGVGCITSITAGGAFSLALRSDGTVWMWGRKGEPISAGMYVYDAKPVKVGALTDVVAIAAGHAHALAIKRDGTIWSWGNNFYGQLGDSRKDGWTPTQIGSGYLKEAKYIAAGFSHSLVAAQDAALGYPEALYSWGHNASGQVGQASLKLDFPYPQPVYDAKHEGPAAGMFVLPWPAP